MVWNFDIAHIGAGGFLPHLAMAKMANGKVRVIVGTDSNGGYRKDDITPEVEEWKQIIGATTLPAADVQPRTGSGVGAIALSTKNPDVAAMAFQNNIYTSSDGALTWDHRVTDILAPAGDNFRELKNRLQFDPTNADVLYYNTTRDGLMRSLDRGITWTTRTDVPQGVVLTSNAGGGIGNFGRDSWKDPATGQGYVSGGVTALVIDPNGGLTADGTRLKHLFATSFGNGLYESNNGGDTWTKIGGTTLDNLYVKQMELTLNGNLTFITEALPPLKPKFPDIRLLDLHTNAWRVITPSGVVKEWKEFAVDPVNSGRILVMAAGGSMAISYDHGETYPDRPNRTIESANDIPWLGRVLNAGGTTGYMTPGDLGFEPGRPNRVWFTEGIGVWYADIPFVAGQTMINWHGESAGIEQLIPNGERSIGGLGLAVAAWDRSLLNTHDVRHYPATNYPDQFGSAWHLAQSPFDRHYLCAPITNHQDSTGVERSCYSTDDGDTYTPFATVPVTLNAAGKNTYVGGTMAVSQPGNIVWGPSRSGRPHVTIDHGNTWTPVNIEGVTNYSQINSMDIFVLHRNIIADPVVPGRFYMYTSAGGCYISTDRGFNFFKASATNSSRILGVDFAWHVRFVAKPGVSGTLLLTPGQLGGKTTDGLYYSNDSGATWAVRGNLKQVFCLDYGPPLAGQTNPALYAVGFLDGLLEGWGIFVSNDDGLTWERIGTYPAGRLAGIVSLTASYDTPGVFFMAMGGGGWMIGQQSVQQQNDQSWWAMLKELQNRGLRPVSQGQRKVLHTTLLGPPPLPPVDPPPPPPVTDPANLPFWGMPVWRDEFDGTAVDASNWNVRTRADLGLTIDSAIPNAANVTVTGGRLHIKGTWLANAPQSRPLSKTGVDILTHNTGYIDQHILQDGDVAPYSQQYGRWEFRAKTPTGPNTLGALAAFWLRSDDTTAEIDMMEAFGYGVDMPTTAGARTYLKDTFKTTFFTDTSTTASEVLHKFGRSDGGSNVIPWGGFHTYAFEYMPTYCKSYCDDQLLWTLTPADTPALWTAPEFQTNYHLRINLHVGPSNVYYGVPDPANQALTQDPLDYAIEYVRIYAAP